MTTYRRPYKFNELTEEAKKQAVRAINPLVSTLFGERKMHPITVQAFMEAKETIDRYGIRHYEKLGHDQTNLHMVSFEQGWHMRKDLANLHTIMRTNLTPSLHKIYERTIKMCSDLKWSLTTTWEEEPFSLAVKTYSEDSLTKEIDSLNAMKYILDYCTDEDITAQYMLRVLVPEAVEYTEEFRDDLSKHLQITANEVVQTLTSTINEKIKELNNELKSIFDSSLDEENQFKYCRKHLEVELSGLNLQYWFESNGQLVASFSDLTDEFKETYADWNKYQKMKYENNYTYQQIYNYIKCENDTGNLMAP